MRLGVTPATLRRLKREGKIAAVHKRGGTWWYERAEVERAELARIKLPVLAELVQIHQKDMAAARERARLRIRNARGEC